MERWVKYRLSENSAQKPVRPLAGRYLPAKLFLEKLAEIVSAMMTIKQN